MSISPRRTCSDVCAKKLANRSRVRWSKTDESILLEIAESLPLNKLVNVYNNLAAKNKRPHRTRTAIVKRCAKLNLSIVPVYNTFTTTRVAHALGITVDRVYNWIDRGLKTTRTCKKRRARHFIKIENLRAYARKRPEDFAGVDFDELFLLIEDRSLVDQIKAAYPNFLNGIRSQKIWCSNTNQAFSSQGQASKALGISRASIYKAIKYCKPVCGFYFESID